MVINISTDVINNKAIAMETGTTAGTVGVSWDGDVSIGTKGEILSYIDIIMIKCNNFYNDWWILCGFLHLMETS